MHAPPSLPAPSLPIRRALALFLASVTALALFGADDAAAKKKVPKAPSDFFGVSAVRPTADDFAGMAKLGAGTYRVEFGWPSIQARQDGPFNFTQTDQRVAEAAANGMKIVPIVFGTPGFLTGDGARIYAPTGDNTQRSEWQDFVEAVVTRYRDGGTFWQANPQLDARLAPDDLILWNEQNAAPFWWPKANPKQYGALLRITREAIDRVDKKLKIVTGGMFGFPKDKKNSINAKPYLKKLYKQRQAKKIIDGVSVHPYDGKLKGVEKQVKQARQVMNKAKDKKAKIIIGEFGWSSGGPRKNAFVKSKKGQAKLLKQAHNFFLKKRKSWKIESLYWFSYNDHAGDGFCLWCPKAGLVAKNGTLKPSGRAYKKLVKQKSR